MLSSIVLKFLAVLPLNSFIREAPWGSETHLGLGASARTQACLRPFHFPRKSSLTLVAPAPTQPAHSHCHPSLPGALAGLQGGCESRDRALASVSIWPRVPCAKRVPDDRSRERLEKSSSCLLNRGFCAVRGWAECANIVFVGSDSPEHIQVFSFTKAFLKAKILCRFISFCLFIYLE